MDHPRQRRVALFPLCSAPQETAAFGTLAVDERRGDRFEDVGMSRERRFLPNAVTPATAVGFAAVAGPVVLMSLMALTPGLSFTEDLGRHLLLGRIIFETGSVPDTNLLTYTHPEFPFVNHHWLSEVVFFLLHRVAGYHGLIVFKIAMMAVALLLAMTAVRPKRHHAVYWLAGIAAATILSFRHHIRPEQFTYLGVGLYLFGFERLRRGARWPRYLIPAYAFVWANAQIYFVFGLGMAGAFVLERWLAERRWSARLRGGGWWLLLLALSVLNPQGLTGVLYPFAIFGDYGLSVTENISPLEWWRTVLNPMLMVLPFYTLATLLSIAVLLHRHWRREDPQPVRTANLIIAVAAVVAAWQMARSTPLLALAALPVFAEALSPSGRRQPSVAEDLAGGTGSGLRRSAAAVVAAVLGVAVLTLNVGLARSVIEGSYSRVFPGPIYPIPFGFDDEARYLRLGKIWREWGLKGPVFNDYNIGSLVEWQIYPEPAYVDNRPEAFPGSFWRTEYYPVVGNKEEWHRMAKARDINVVIVSLTGVGAQLFQDLLERPDWVLVDFDDVTMIFVRNHPRNQAVVDAHRVTRERVDAWDAEIARRIGVLPTLPFWNRPLETERIAQALYVFLNLNEAQRVWKHARALNALYPDYRLLHELIRNDPSRKELGSLWPLYAQRARWPLAVRQVMAWGQHLIATGRPNRARAVFRRGRWFFPLSPELEQALQKLDDDEYLRRRELR
jgi:hypothetical protein